MNKIRKNWIIALLCGVLACGVMGATGLSGVGLKVADANTEAKFEMESGAAVCIADGKTGIRWTTTVNQKYYDSLSIGANTVEFGVLVAPRNNIAAGSELTVDTDEVEVIPCTSFNGFNANGEFTYYSSILYDELTSEETSLASAVELAARAYVKIGEEYSYVDEYEVCTRSMRAVAYDVYLCDEQTIGKVGKYFGEQTISEIASGYFSEVDGKATLTNVNNLANGTYKASVNAQPVKVEVEDATLTVSGALTGLTAGENYQLNVFGDSTQNKNDIFAQEFTYATLVIDQATDLDYFYLGNDRTCDKTTFTEEDTFNGYYILANDIDCTGYIFGASKEPAGETPSNLLSPNSIGSTGLRGVGLTGVFDGNGYSITNFAPNGAGLFAAINGGTLRNVSISGTGTHLGNGAFLCEVMRGATLENVYVNAGRHTAYGTLGLSKFILNSTLENCVFKSTTSDSGRTWGGMIFEIQESTFTNCYAITNRPLSADAPAVYDAANKKPEGDTSATVWVEGIKRYKPDENTTDVPVWKNVEVVLCDKDGNEVGNSIGLTNGASVELMAYSNGVVCDQPIIEIKQNGGNVAVEGTKLTVTGEGESTILVKYAANGNAYEKEIIVSMVKEEIVYGKTLTFSAKDGLFFDGANVVSLNTILGEGVELSSVEHATDTLTVSKGAILGLTTNGKSVTTTQIELHSVTKKVTVNVNAYTLVIDEATDLDYFYLGNDRSASATLNTAWTETDVFGGYYVLAKDIDAKGYTFGAAKEGEGETPSNLTKPDGIGSTNLQNMGLTGTFDGQGYSITNFTPNGTGLFAAINGGTLKNVRISSTGSYGGKGAFLCAMMRNATLENVYVDAGALSSWGTLGLSKFVLDSTLKNCVFKYTMGTSGRTWGGLIFQIADSTFTDCYVVSNRPLSADAPNAYDAVNKKPDGDTSATVWVEGIKRYATAADMIADKANNNYDSFVGTYWDCTSGMPVWKTKA